MKLLDDGLELVKTQIVQQAFLITIVFVAVIYLLIVEKPVPDVLYGFGGSIIGYYFMNSHSK